MREYRSYGSVRGAVGNNRPYRERHTPLDTVSFTPISCRNRFFAFGPCAEYEQRRWSAEACFLRHAIASDLEVEMLCRPRILA